MPVPDPSTPAVTRYRGVPPQRDRSPSSSASSVSPVLEDQLATSAGSSQDRLESQPLQLPESLTPGSAAAQRQRIQLENVNRRQRERERVAASEQQDQARLELLQRQESDQRRDEDRLYDFYLLYYQN